MNAAPAWLVGARGAPSAHNTQPWRFKPSRDGSIAVRWAAERALPIADPTSRDLYLALGAAVEAARLRSGLAGAPLTFSPTNAAAERTIGHLEPASDTLGDYDQSLVACLDARQTGRVPHMSRPIPLDVVTAMRAEAERFGGALLIIDQGEHRRRLSALTRQATAAQFADPAVHGELWRWLRLDSDAPAYRRDGLTADCLELRGPSLAIARATMPPGRMRRLARVGVHHLLALETARVVRRSMAVCLLMVPVTSRAQLVTAGRLLLRLWLIAARANLTTHPLSALIDNSATIGPATAVFRAAGRAPTGAVPVAIFRLGACRPVARSPRLPAGELLEAHDAND